MDYMFQPGFLGTKAPFFMDFVTIIVAALPLLVAIAIYFAKKETGVNKYFLVFRCCRFVRKF